MQEEAPEKEEGGAGGHASSGNHESGTLQYSLGPYYVSRYSFTLATTGTFTKAIIALRLNPPAARDTYETEL